MRAGRARAAIRDSLRALPVSPLGECSRCRPGEDCTGMPGTRTRTPVHPADIRSRCFLTMPSTTSDCHTPGLKAMPWPSTRCIEADMEPVYAGMHAEMVASEVTPLADRDKPGGSVVRWMARCYEAGLPAAAVLDEHALKRTVRLVPQVFPPPRAGRVMIAPVRGCAGAVIGSVADGRGNAGRGGHELARAHWLRCTGSTGSLALRLQRDDGELRVWGSERSAAAPGHGAQRALRRLQAAEGEGMRAFVCKVRESHSNVNGLPRPLRF